MGDRNFGDSGQTSNDHNIYGKRSKKSVDRRYIVTILWKDNKLKLQNNYSNAGKRLGGKEKRLSKDEELVEVIRTF